jgi:uncharacterized protein with ATP-grasp and redox domains
LDAPKEKGSPWFGPGVTALLEKHCGLTGDRFKEEKEMSNRFVLQRLEEIRSRIVSAEDPLYAGLQMAVLGNYIDFSALKGEVSFEKLDEMLEKAGEIALDRRNYEKLCADLAKGKNLLYITDNAGEIGFDRLLAEEIAREFPDLQITFCVRGGPASNDATREDAAAVGITFPVIDNGCTIAGTELELLPPETMKIFREADVILSKGQANVETLYGCGLNIYYLFLIKCARFQEYFGKEKLTPMLLT